LASASVARAASERSSCVVLGERAVGPAHREQAVCRSARRHLPQGHGGEIQIVDRGLAHAVAGQRSPLGLVDRPLQPGQQTDADRLGQRIGGRRPRAHPPAVGVAGLDGRLEGQLQQRLAVEPRGERLADAPDRLPHPRALLLELVEAPRQLARHVVELLAQQRELVAPGDRDRRGEVAAAEPPGGLQESGS
jgi:hypothetical protein